MSDADRVEDTSLDMGPWKAYASSHHGGRVFWIHDETGHRTWAQPLPERIPLRACKEFNAMAVNATWSAFIDICYVCTADFGSKVPSCKTISGSVPDMAQVLASIEHIAPAFLLYAPGFPQAAGLDQIVFCSKLHYGGQRRGHVPSFHSRTMYIDCLPQPKRRAVSSFHHELWHFADYTMLGRDYEFGDAEWQQLNPEGFRYGKGGAAMRSEDSTSGYMGSAGCDSFLNRYSTASAAEDKAEVWAATMTAAELLQQSPTLSQKSHLLQQRAAQLTPGMADSQLWMQVLHAQHLAKGEDDEWEQYVTDAGRPWWFNRTTHEKRWVKPESSKKQRTASTRSRFARQTDGMQRESSLIDESMQLPSPALAESIRVARRSSSSSSLGEPMSRRSFFNRIACCGCCMPFFAVSAIEHAEDDEL